MERKQTLKSAFIIEDKNGEVIAHARIKKLKS